MTSPKDPQSPNENGSGSRLPPPPRPDGLVKMRRRWFPAWRFFTWVILIFNLLMLIWVISAITTGKDCRGLTGDRLTNCEAGNIGTGIGVGLIILLWALGDVILGVLWLVTRPHRRTCPVCGNTVRRGVTQCPSCGYDFTGLLGHPGSGNRTRQQPVRGPDGRYYTPDGMYMWNGSTWISARQRQ